MPDLPAKAERLGILRGIQIYNASTDAGMARLMTCAVQSFLFALSSRLEYTSQQLLCNNSCGPCSEANQFIYKQLDLRLGMLVHGAIAVSN